MEPTSARKELTPSGSALREVGQLFDKMYTNLNSLRLPSEQQYDENLLDDLSSFKDKVQVRDFSEYLRPSNQASRKGTADREHSPDLIYLLQSKRRNPREPGDASSPAFSPKLAVNGRPDRQQSVSLQLKEASYLNTLLSQRQSENRVLQRKVKELESANRQLQSQMQQALAAAPQQQPDSKLAKMVEELQFLTQNNQHLYRTSVRLTEQLEVLRTQLADKIERETELKGRIAELEKDLSVLKKLNRQLLRDQSNMVRSSEEETSFFKTVKEEFERETTLLKKKIHFLEVERNTSVNALKSMSMGATGTKFFSSSTHRPAESQDASEVEKLRQEVEHIKNSLSGLSTKKVGSSLGKSSKATPLRKGQARLD